MTYIYVVKLYSTGENWHTFVCANLGTAIRAIMKGYGISVGNITTDMNYMEYISGVNPHDPSQTATIMRQYLVDDTSEPEV